MVRKRELEVGSRKEAEVGVCIGLFWNHKGSKGKGDGRVELQADGKECEWEREGEGKGEGGRQGKRENVAEEGNEPRSIYTFCFLFGIT